jgi:hypothetical protein
MSPWIRLNERRGTDGQVAVVAARPQQASTCGARPPPSPSATRPRASLRRRRVIGLTLPNQVWFRPCAAITRLRTLALRPLTRAARHSPLSRRPPAGDRTSGTGTARRSFVHSEGGIVRGGTNCARQDSWRNGSVQRRACTRGDLNADRTVAGRRRSGGLFRVAGPAPRCSGDPLDRGRVRDRPVTRELGGACFRPPLESARSSSWGRRTCVVHLKP